MERTPLYASHLRSNRLFDQDNMFLAIQDRELALRGRGNWAREYYMPVSCDSAIIAARRWLDAMSALPLDGKAGGPPAASAFTLPGAAVTGTPRPTSAQINDRFMQHTVHCAVCTAALAKSRKVLQAARTAGLVLATAAVGLFAAAAVAVASQGSVPGIAAGLVVKLACAACAAATGAAVAAAAARAAAARVAEFIFQEFSHAHND